MFTISDTSSHGKGVNMVKATKYKNIWVDLTDFTIWRGTHTGTQRVVYQIVKHFPETDKIKYCWYDYKSRSYVETSREEAFRENEEYGTQSISTQKKGKIKNLSSRGVRAVSPPVVTRVAESIKRKLYSKEVDHGVSVNLDIGKGDALLVLGGNWDKPGFIDALEEVSSRGIELVHNINDFIPIFDKGHVSSDEHVRYEDFMRRVIVVADRLTAISDHTKKDIQEYCRLNKLECPNIEVIRLGDDSVNKESKEVTGMPSEFILSVSTIEVRKNHTLLYYVYKEAYRRGIDLPNLILAGRRGWLTGDLQFMLVHDPEVKDKITIVEGPSDKELSWLYQNCRFTVYPSFYEGWGLPVAESVLYGKYCLATNSTSVPEVAGELLDYFSPYNTEECLQGIIKALDDSYLNKKVKALKSGYKPTSWEETSDRLLEYLEVSV